jgi:predicted amidohydrolase
VVSVRGHGAWAGGDLFLEQGEHGTVFKFVDGVGRCGVANCVDGWRLFADA